MISKIKDGIGLKGCFRLRIRENDRVVSTSKWYENLIVDDGIEKYVARSFAGEAGSLQVSHVTIGTGGVPASNATAIPGEAIVSSRRGAVTKAFSQRANSTNTATQQFTATLASSDSFITAAANISNIGLVNSSTNGTIMAGQTYASSALATNQNVEITYQIRLN
jgi:hypothetical protein